MTQGVKLRLVKPEAEPSAPSSARDAREALHHLADEGLVALVCGGDSRAAEALYRRHAAFAFNLAARIAGSTSDVEDVVQDAFIRAFDNLGSLRKPSAFKTWLGSIVVHAMRSRLRRSRFLRLFGLGHPGDIVEIDSIANESASPHVKAELAQVYALLKTLPADDRIAWTLRFVEGHDLGAAAELSGCSLATVKRRIRRAQRYLAAHYVTATGDDEESELDDELTPTASPTRSSSSKEAAS